MAGVAELDPEPFAELVRPAVNRVQRGVRDRTRANGGAELARRYGLPSPELLDTLRFVLPRGPLHRAAFALAARYDPAETVSRQVDELVAGHWLVPSGDELALSERAAAFLDELYDLHARVTTTCWPEELSGLLDMVGRLLTAAAETGGPAFAVFAPPYERPGDPPGVLLFNRLAALRYHRSDAHAAAWAARGLTADEIVALPADTPLRQEIEADTNRRAAPPYEALNPSERLQFLAGLAALA
jgi:hypothetical protein